MYMNEFQTLSILLTLIFMNKFKNNDMKKNISLRTLKADEIEVRVQQIKDGKAIMLLYIDSRAATELLDETFGNMNWTSEFYDVNGKTFCKIGVYDEDRKIWVWKSDVGSESNIEAEKGMVSDAYKRVLTRFGVTELYSAPRITIPDDGYKCSGYKVSEIQYDERRRIIHLVIVNKFGKEVFRWSSNNHASTNSITPNMIGDNKKPCINASFIDNNMDMLEWNGDNGNYIGMLPKQQQSKQNPIEILNTWYSSITNPNPIEEKFYNQYRNKINNRKWKGQFDLDKLLEMWNIA